jgi:hypothetical protein
VIDDVDLVNVPAEEGSQLSSPWPDVFNGFQYFMQGFGKNVEVLDWCSNNIFLKKTS